MTTDDLDHQQAVHRHREAVPAYSIVVGCACIPLVLFLLESPRQWNAIGVILVLIAVMLRYLGPVRATVLPDGRVRYVWPLRRVTVGPENLVTARVLANTISQEPLLALRVRSGARFAAFSTQWTDGPRLAAALAGVVAEASKVPALDRQASVALLAARASSRPARPRRSRAHIDRQVALSASTAKGQRWGIANTESHPSRQKSALR